MSEWKPIESAPMDGSDIDLWCNHRRITDCYWKPSANEGAGWYRHVGNHEYTGMPIEEKVIGAIHWMPIPEPPLDK
ncbi:MAG: hypothetical protein U1D69_12155 [Polynucleobacter sp.]|uniref:hypothetical protein n=1 Tax=Limnobacter sp. TaxID=2003368 RepID=UPI0027375A5B|nr:hypothetical protein [Limnobacter sp.]MDP3273432.1 hypothetical protein [Limnobacter sp.]MDZ4057690.1 hypothetical protein [Polynucleobacter sp.]